MRAHTCQKEQVEMEKPVTVSTILPASELVRVDKFRRKQVHIPSRAQVIRKAISDFLDKNIKEVD